MMDFSEILGNDEILKAAGVLRESFLTVANEFNFTEKNAPTNAAFITSEKLKESINNGVRLFGLYYNKKLIGTIGIEKSKENDQVYYLERLAVLPSYRHSGYGKRLMDLGFKEIKKKNGVRVSIGIINENIRLKEWYNEYGFREVMIKEYNHLPFKVCFMEYVL